MAWIDLSSRPSRRRAQVFTIAFLAAAVASLVYTFSRPPEYRAQARLHIVPTSAPTLPAGDGMAVVAVSGPHDAAPFLTEVQILTSRPLLTDVVQHLRDGGTLPDLGVDPVAGVQRMLSVEPVAGTQVAVLSAEGPDRTFLPRLVNAVTDSYRRRVADSYAANAASADAGLIDEEKSLAADMAAKQTIVEAYRKRYDIISLERNENQVLAKLNGLNNTYNDANAKLAAATGQLEAARKGAQGQGAYSAKDDPTLADLEQRASKIREQLQELQRKFTPDYLALDSDAQAARARLADLEQQIAARRVTSGQAATGRAQEAYTSAKAEVDQLGREIADSQQAAQDFATHLSAYKALQQDLDHVEALHRNALDRLTQFQATTRQRAPEVELLEAAAVPREPVRPDYQTYAIVSVAGSLAFGLIAVLFGEFIAGPAPASPGMTVRHTWMPSALGYAGSVSAERAVMPPPRMVELPAPEPPRRELADAEVAALAGAGDDARLVCVALLMGLTADELVAVRWDAVDLRGNIIRVAGISARSFALEEPLRGLIAARQSARPRTAGPLLHDASGMPLGADELARLVLYAAYDAGLEQPHEVTPAVLRHTYLTFLLRQGMRMGDIGRIAGHIPQADLAAYMQIAGSSVRLPFEKIDRILPTLRGLAAA